MHKLATSSDRVARLNEPLCSLRLVKSSTQHNDNNDDDDDDESKSAYSTKSAHDSLVDLELSRAELRSFIDLLHRPVAGMTHSRKSSSQ